MRSGAGFTLLEIMLAVFIIGVGVIPVLNLFLSSSRTVEKGGVILEAVIAAQDILDRAKSDSFIWDHVPFKISVPDERFPQFTIPEFFARKYQATASLIIMPAAGHTVIGTGFNEENLIHVAVTIHWVENTRVRSSKLETYRANINSFNLKTSARF
jgi:prepilin-type N-terminal cleavage/methylation domain-containing protein